MLKGTAAFTGLAAVQASGLAQPVQATPDAGRGGDAGQRAAGAGAWADGFSWRRSPTPPGCQADPGSRPGRRARRARHPNAHTNSVPSSELALIAERPQS